MQTNSQAQQTTRRMTAAQKAAVIRERIAADHAVNEAHAAKFRATQAMWNAAHAAGLTPAELHTLDMALMCGADSNDLLRTIEGAQIAATLQHAEGFRANCAGIDFQEFQPAAWQTGWLDAQELGEFAPLVWLRTEAEA